MKGGDIIAQMFEVDSEFLRIQNKEVMTIKGKINGVVEEEEQNLAKERIY